MAWPTPQDYNEAVQSPKIVFSDRQLRKAVPETTKLGLPKPITGNFACVYRFASGKKEWAVRCFHRRYAGRRNRYSEISHTLAALRLPYTVPFDYIDRGIRLRGQWYPILKMEWVRGLLLGSYIEKNLANAKAIRTLAAKWRAMASALQEAGIAHGDLQHGNILVVKGEIRLVDYDGMYVPGLAGLRSNETGHPNFQHPHRMGSHFGPHLDNFSAWVIYVSLAALATDSTLWEKTTRGDEALLFRKKDFEYPAQSRAFALLRTSGDSRVRALVKKLEKIVRLPLSQVPSLDEKAPKKPAPAPKPAPPAPKAAPPAPAPKPAPAAASPPKRAPAVAPPKPPPKRAPAAAPPAPAPPPKRAPAAAPPAPAPPPKRAPVAAPPPAASKPASATAPPRRPAAPLPPRPAPPRRPAAPPAMPAPPRKPRRAVVRVLAGAWWLFIVLANAWYVAAGRMLAAFWWLLKLCARGGYVLFRAILWRAPSYAFGVAGRSYGRLSPRRRKLVLIGGAVMLVTLSAASFAWYIVLSERLVTGGPDALAASPGAQEEVCEFLARPAASLYIDGELVRKEIPPLYRTVLSVGDHRVQFVSPSGVTREETIRVVKGRPKQWFMNFVDGRVRRRPPVSVRK